jgi:membrane-associated PAP2 superfamily phosphatase
MLSVGRVGFWFTVSGLVIYSLFANGKIDLWLSRLLYDASSQTFVWGKSEFVDLVLYRGHKWLMTLVAFGLVWWGARAVWAHRRGFGLKHLAVGIIGTVCIIVAVGALKKITGIDCPWSIDEFGGSMPFIPMQEVVRLAFDGQVGQGRCFPAGHSTGGLFLLAWAVAFYDTSRRASAWLIAAGMLLGLLMGLVRMTQGAHFLSHVIWAMWSSAFFAYLLWVVFLPPSGSALDKRNEITA